MSQSASSNRFETLVGAAVVALALGFLVYASKTAGIGGGGSGGYTVIAEFDNAEGINVGTDVRLAGIKIGTVTGQNLNPENYMARIEMSLDPTIQLSDDTAAKVTSEGLLGGKFIALEPGGSDTKLAQGSVLTLTQGAVDIWSLISQTMFASKKPADAAAPETPAADTPAPATPPPQ